LVANPGDADFATALARHLWCLTYSVEIAIIQVASASSCAPPGLSIVQAGEVHVAEGYYAILGLDASASPEEIKSAYRQKAKQLHPDRSGSLRQQEVECGQEIDCGPFRAVQEAYEVLSDPARRRAYDAELAREHGIQRHRQPGRRPRSHPAAEPLIPSEPVADVHIASRDSRVHREERHVPFLELFDRLWEDIDALWPTPAGDHMSQGSGVIHVTVRLTRSQAMQGGRTYVSLFLRSTCPACRGHGGAGYYLCEQCGGRGSIVTEHPVWVEFPPRTSERTVARFALDGLGMPGSALEVHFWVQGW
jgi:molecular chaperone DnaJ